MRRPRIPARSPLSAILMCVLLQISVLIVASFAILGDGEWWEWGDSARDTPLACDECAEPYYAWVAAENAREQAFEAAGEDLDDDMISTHAMAVTDARWRYEACVRQGCKAPSAPRAHFTYEAVDGLTIRFDASSSTGDIKSYSWSFGDYATDRGSTVRHTYWEAGSYEVLLTVNSGESTESQYRVQVTVGQHSLQIESITPLEELAFDTEIQWQLSFAGTSSSDGATMHFDVYDQKGTHLGSYGMYDLYWQGTVEGYEFDKSITAGIRMPSGTTGLTFKAYLHGLDDGNLIAVAEKEYPFETLEIVGFSCDAPVPGALGAYYEVTATIVDKNDNGPWRYMFKTGSGKFLNTHEWSYGSHENRAFIERDDSMSATVGWQAPTKESTLELEYAKNMLQVTKDLARNMTATGSSTIPIIGRVLKGANDVYNLYNDIGTMSGYAGKSWAAMTRGELLRAVMHASNAAVEGFQVTAGGVLLLPKALAPTGLAEVASACTDVLNAGIDYAQVSWETLAGALADEAQASKVIWASIVVRVANRTGGRGVGRSLFLELADVEAQR